MAFRLCFRKALALKPQDSNSRCADVLGALGRLDPKNLNHVKKRLTLLIAGIRAGVLTSGGNGAFNFETLVGFSAIRRLLALQFC